MNIRLELDMLALHRMDDDGGPPAPACTSDDSTNHQGDTCPIHEAQPFVGNGRGYVTDEDEDKFDRLLSDPFGRF